MVRGLTQSEKELAAHYGGVLGMLKVGLSIAEKNQNYELCATINRVVKEMESSGCEELMIVSKDDEGLPG